MRKKLKRKKKLKPFSIWTALKLDENVLSVRWNDVFIYKLTVVRIYSGNCYCSSINQCLDICMLFFFSSVRSLVDILGCTSCALCWEFRSVCGHVTFDRMFESQNSLFSLSNWIDCSFLTIFTYLFIDILLAHHLASK